MKHISTNGPAPAADTLSSGSVEPSDRGWMTVPNLITLIRFLCIPLFVWLLFGKEDRGSAALLLGALGSTDWVDGYIARRFDQGSTIGKVIDPAVDRVLLGTAIVCLFIDESVPRWVFWVVLVREVLVSVGTLGLAAAGARRIDVQWVGKAGTFGLMVALPCFLAGASTWGVRDWFRGAAWVWLIPSLALAYYAAFTYIPLGRQALAEGRATRAHKG
jgi:cardiolipin synthase (CMP-forming)